MLGHIIAESPALPEKFRGHPNVGNKLVGKTTKPKKFAHKPVAGKTTETKNYAHKSKVGSMKELVVQLWPELHGQRAAVRSHDNPRAGVIAEFSRATPASSSRSRTKLYRSTSS